MTLNPLAFAELRQRRLLALGREQHAQARYSSLGLTVSQAKGRLALAPTIKLALDELQRREHARSVGAFEELLTSLLRDVFPEERSVHLDLATARGLPALNINISKDKAHQQREDTKSGTGGGVTNGLSLGLRLISLIRSGHRPFIILDEPDCWLEIARVPDMAQLIQQAAQQIGVQVLMISHHPDHLLAAIPHRLMLERGAQGLETHWAPSAERPTWTDDQPGIRAIYFEDCYGHSSTFLPLAPGVTLLRGPNDLGKSSLVSALTAALTDMGDDTMIRHGQDKALVRMDFGPDGLIQFERRRKPKKTKEGTEPKVHYQYFDATQNLADPATRPVRESTNAKELPEWVREISGIGDIEGLNVQLREQKEPVFLLNESPSVRARALAIGSESALVQAMMVQEKRELAEAKTRVTDGEKELEYLHRQLQALAPLVAHQASFQALERYMVERAERQAQRRAQQGLLDRWRRAEATARALAPLRSRVAPVAPAPSPVASWQRLVTAWQRAEATQEAVRPLLQTAGPRSKAPAQAPTLQPLLTRWRHAAAVTQALLPLCTQAAPVAPERTAMAPGLARRWRQTQARHTVLAGFLAHPAPTAPAPNDALGQVQAQHDAWRTAQALRDAEVAALAQAQAEEAEGLAQVEAAMAALHQEFPACPLCHRAF